MGARIVTACLMSNKSDAVWCVIPAAGGGSRMGAGVPKQYLQLDGCCVLERAVRVFDGLAAVTGIAVGLAPDDAFWDTTELPGLDRVHTYTGGRERVHTVLGGLRFLIESLGAGPGDWVLVHDAARPLVKAVDVERLLTQCRENDLGGLLAAELVDTVKRDNGSGAVAVTVEREGLWRALTPQCFKLSDLESAVASAVRDGIIATDESNAMERAGHEVLLVRGDRNNLKITYPGDIHLARCLVAL